MRSDPVRLALLALGLLGPAMLAGALAFQHLLGLAPCVLCVWQRWPWVAVALIGLLGAFLLPARLRPAALGLAAVTLLVGAGIAGFHVGVEQQWWAGTAECGSGNLYGSGASVADIRRQLMSTPVVRCDEVAWSLAGISMAGWNGLIGLAAAAFALRALVAGRA